LNKPSIYGTSGDNAGDLYASGIAGDNGNSVGNARASPPIREMTVIGQAPGSSRMMPPPFRQGRTPSMRQWPLRQNRQTTVSQFPPFQASQAGIAARPQPLPCGFIGLHSGLHLSSPGWNCWRPQERVADQARPWARTCRLEPAAQGAPIP